jgi:acyl-CoA synthetase (AMP-forming)/AMP-acid ligase II
MLGDHVVLATSEGYRGKNVIARFWEIVDRFRVSIFSGVPTLYAALLEIPIGDNDLSSLKFAGCGAAPMPAALIRAFEAKTGVKILEGYGLTEGACVSSINPIEGERFAGSIGLPIPYQRMAAVILDGEGRFSPIRTRSGSSRSTGPTSFQATSTRITTKASSSRSMANAGSTPATSAGGIRRATSGSQGGRRSLLSAAGTIST